MPPTAFTTPDGNAIVLYDANTMRLSVVPNGETFALLASIGLVGPTNRKLTVPEFDGLKALSGENGGWHG